jgi:transcription initiation factor TFIID subunit 1, fungi type
MVQGQHKRRPQCDWFPMDAEESKAIAALSGLGLNSFLSAEGLPATDIYADQLGLSRAALFNERNAEADEDAIGADVGEDMEEDVEPELYPEPESQQAGTSAQGALNGAPKKKKVRVVKRMVERPKSVYERYPSFRPGNTLAFSELFKGYINRKSRISKRPFHGTSNPDSPSALLIFKQSTQSIRIGATSPKATSNPSSMTR